MKNNYQNWSEEELIQEIERLKKRKKYGLVWEEKTIKIDIYRHISIISDIYRTKGS